MIRKWFLGIALSVSLAGCANMPPHSEAQVRASPPAGCVYPGTATRLPARPSECAAFGRSWSQEDLQRTGKFDVGQALQMLDPSVSSNH